MAAPDCTSPSSPWNERDCAYLSSRISVLPDTRGIITGVKHLRRCRCLAVVAIWLCCPLISLEAQSVGTLGLQAGVVFVGNAHEDSAPSPVTQIIGISVPAYDAGLLNISAAIGVFSTLHQLDGGIPRPVEIEVPGQSWVQILDAFFDLQIGMAFSPIESLKLGVFLGPGVLFRFPVATSEGAEADGEEMMRFFLSDWRFLYPEAGAFVHFPLSEIWSAAVSLKGMYPAYRLLGAATDSYESEFWHDLIVSASVTLLFRLW